MSIKDTHFTCNDGNKNDFTLSSKSRDELKMQRSLFTLPFLNRHLVLNGLRIVPKVVQQAATITSLNLNKQSLPKQPIPDLKVTIERYLKSLKPLLNNDEYCNTERIVNKFVNDENCGPILYCKLQERFERTENWMSEWWLQEAYLGYRAPVIVNSSPGTVGPSQTFTCPQDMYIFAARLIGAVYDYDCTIKCGDMKQEMVRNEPLNMQPYAMILGTHRQPSRGYDKLIHTDNAKHIVIVSNNHFFKLNIVDGNNKLIDESKLAASIKDIVERSCTEAKPVGILTGNHRDIWAEDHCLLKDIGCNEKILKDIECSLFLLCLDKEIPKKLFEDKNDASVRAVQSMTGFSNCTNAGNRWHDKTVQFIVSTDGFVGIEYEHSPCEGGPIAVLYDHVITYISNKKNNEKCDNSKDFPKAESLKFELNDALESAIENAKCKVDEISNNIDMECYTFDGFGSNEIKKIKFSPDSFIQIAMQVAFYKLHGKPPAHYESAALRRFKNARTECIRSTSVESVDFANMMTCSDISKEQKKEAMIKAINMHKQLAGQAALGEGVDRLLFGLKMIAKCEKMKIPELYSDVGFTRSTHFNLTSSQVPYKTASFMCYGPVVPDGYGCCYNPRPNDILFACSSFKASKETCTKEFANGLREALCEMKSVAEC